MFDGAIKRTVSSGNVELAVLEAGDPARPTVVLVHGYPDTKELWAGVFGRLSGRFHVVAYDVRGAGASAAPRGPGAYDFERLADDFAAVVAAVSPGSPVHLVGHDWGGIAGWELAAMPRLRETLLSFTTIAGPSLPQLGEGLRDQLRRGRVISSAGRLRRSWYVLALCTPGVPTVAWRAVLGRGAWRGYLRYVERIPNDPAYPRPTLAQDGRHGSNLYRRNIVWRSPGPRAPLPVPVPVQLIVPSGDRFISPDYYDRAERYAPHVHRRIVPGSHWVPRSQPALLASWIAEFVEDVERGSSSQSTPWRRGGGVEQLHGRLALVTGAGSGIGRATARALAAHGARLLLVDRDAPSLAASADSIPGSHTFVCDVADAEAMERLANRVLGEHGVPDVVVNNAGIGVAGPFLDTGFDDWRRVLDVNVMGVVHGCRLFGRAMAQRGAGGQIVNTSSAAGFAPTKELPAYAASKAAVLMLSECLRAELHDAGIGVTAVCPGIVATNITRTTRWVGRPEQDQERIRERVTSLYQRRNFTPEQVAAEIVAAIGADTPVAAVTPEARALRAVARFAPGVARRLARLDALPV
ncbi:MAG TPA: SDR family oxidoreductase [Solirubrobacteraceae bacterium]|nr:SDR family oxidoreductase [Solirubrobacteraceae bacterium]